MTETIKAKSVTSALIVINAAVFLFMTAAGNVFYNPEAMLRLGAMFEPLIAEEHEYYRMLSACFLHFGIEHIVNNMLVLFVIGYALEDSLGSWRYALLYLSGGIFGNIVSYVYHMAIGEYVISAGASGAVFAVAGGLLGVVVQSRGREGSFSAQQILIMLVMSIYLGLTDGGVDNAAHLGGFAGGFLLSLPLYGGGRRRKRRSNPYRGEWEQLWKENEKES